MDNTLLALARDPTFIPLVYDYCDMVCPRCPVAARCVLYVADQMRMAPISTSLEHEGDESSGPESELAFARAMAEVHGKGAGAIAALDVALADPSTAPRAPAIGHPLELLARHYAVQSHQVLESMLENSYPEAPDSPLAVASWLHLLIASKTYRALVSHYRATADTPEFRLDALGSAKLVLVSIDRSLTAWHAVAAREDDGRIGGLIELLEALKTGVEMRFPEARAFLRPGLDCAAGQAEPENLVNP